MHRKARILPSILLLVWLAVLAEMHPFAAGEEPGLSEGPALTGKPAAAERSGAGEQPAATEDSGAGEQPADREETPEAERTAPRPLSPEMIALGDSLRRALAVVARQPLSTRDNTPGQVIQLSLAFGCDATVRYNGASGRPVNAIGCLCWNYPCGGYRLLRTGGDRVVARVGYALQARPAEFLAVLAQSRVPAEYEIRVGEHRGTVADLVAFEKAECPSGTDLSFTLIGLAHYVDDEATWKNDFGEEWSVDRLVAEELKRSPSTSDRDATDRLMGLSCAIHRRDKQGRPLDGALVGARQYVRECHDFALDLQNADGSWHPSFFARRGGSNDTLGTLRSTGHILEWLVFSLPEDRLEDPRVVRSVTYVARLLASGRHGWNVGSMSMRDSGGVLHAAHALSIYDGRVFRRPAAEEPVDEEAPSVASRTTPE